MKDPSLSSHPRADGKLGDVLKFTKPFWSFTAKKSIAAF